MKNHKGEVVWLEGKPYAIAERYSPAISLFAQDTGRWSQKQIPDAQLPSKMRKLKGVDPGHKQLGYDLSNAELRIVAELSQDKLFLDSFAQGWDLHTLNACDLFGWDYPVNREKKAIFHGPENQEWREKYNFFDDENPMRKFAKVFNFRVLYGGDPLGAFKIPGFAATGLSREAGAKSGAVWLSKHPELADFWRIYGDEAEHRFIVRNAYGRRRILCNPDEKARRREGINHPMQSHVSDLINYIVVETVELTKGQLMGQMHDSLLWQFPLDTFDECMKTSLEIPQRVISLDGHDFSFPVSHYIKEYPGGVSI